MSNNYSKIRIQYPDGYIDCDATVAETYRRAIEYFGLERVRSLNIIYNSINIVSTPDEIEVSTGKSESNKTFKGDETLKICTQFDTDCKYKILQTINEAYGSPLAISMVGPSEVRTTTDHRRYKLQITDSEEELQKMDEGMAKEYRATRYERNQTARDLCIRHYGNPVICQICGFDFEKTYGKREGKDPYIEVHHIQPLNEKASDDNHPVDYTKDLIPVCANCHRMLHHLRPHTLTPADLKDILAVQKILNTSH